MNRIIKFTILASICSLSAFGRSNEEMLFHRVKKGQIKEVANLLKLGVYINTLDEHGRTPLHYAVQIGQIDLVKLLLDAEALVNEKDEVGKTPLHYAVQSGQIDLVKLFLDAEALVDETDELGRSPIFYAITAGSAPVIKLLVEYGAADVSLADNCDYTPLYCLLEQYDMPDEDCIDILKLFLERGADARVVPSKTSNPAESCLSRTPLSAAICRESLEMVELLLRNKANPNIPSLSSIYPIHNAAFYLGGSYDKVNAYGLKCIELLVHYNADINIIESKGASMGMGVDGATVLEKAILSDCSAKDIEWLINKGADIKIMMDNIDQKNLGIVRDKLDKLGISDKFNQ